MDESQGCEAMVESECQGEERPETVTDQVEGECNQYNMMPNAIAQHR